MLHLKSMNFLFLEINSRYKVLIGLKILVTVSFYLKTQLHKKQNQLQLPKSAGR